MGVKKEGEEKQCTADINNYNTTKCCDLFYVRSKCVCHSEGCTMMTIGFTSFSFSFAQSGDILALQQGQKVKQSLLIDPTSTQIKKLIRTSLRTRGRVHIGLVTLHCLTMHVT